MTKEQIDQLIDMNCDKISPEYVPAIRERLADADEGIAQAAFASCKGEILMMVMAGFFGCYGVDRFMLGEVGLGVAKLLTCGGCGIWAMIDTFTAPARTRKYNSEKILSQL
jgi:hypothetical protein